ncbi:MAG: hypothetical protein WCW27_02085 [Patescibacteria group bacterium]|jgi:hypothetical protein
MRLTDKQLINLPVYTEIDVLLGYVVSLEIDIDHQTITKYFIAKHKLVPEVLRSLVGVSVYEVAPSQIISINTDKMIVQDTFTRVKAMVVPALSAQPL